MLDWKCCYFVLGGFVTLLTMITLSSRPVHVGEFDQAKLAEIRAQHSARSIGLVKAGWIGIPIALMCSFGTPYEARYAAPSAVAVV